MSTPRILVALTLVSMALSFGCAHDDTSVEPDPHPPASDTCECPCSEQDAGDALPSPQAGTCGGMTGATCNDDEFCDYQPGQNCGAADQQAMCKPRPDICTEEYAPVCGCDGKTYSNHCRANAAGTGVLQEGDC